MIADKPALDYAQWRELPNTLGNRIKFLRCKLGLSVRGAAKIVKMRAATWCETESGKRTPRARSLQQIAWVLGVRPITLTTYELCDLVDLMKNDFPLEPPHPHD